MFIVHTKQSYGASGSIENKVKLQKLLFPSGIVIEPVKRQYRTSKVNSVFSLILSISRDNSIKTHVFQYLHFYLILTPNFVVLQKRGTFFL